MILVYSGFGLQGSSLYITLFTKFFGLCTKSLISIIFLINILDVTAMDMHLIVTPVTCHTIVTVQLIVTLKEIRYV
jgi:hypothetical protein